MSFYNDECDLVDDDQYDLFTSTTILQRHSEQLDRNLTGPKEGLGVERRSMSDAKARGGQRRH